MIMKYLRRYNEEINPNTYRKAADLLSKKGSYHRGRGKDLYDHADFVEWSNLVERVRENGTIKAMLETSRTVSYKMVGEDYVGDFYPHAAFGIDLATDLLGEREGQIAREEIDPKADFGIGMEFFLSLVPATKEVYYGAKEAITEYAKNKTGYHDLSHLSSYPLAFFHFDISFSGGSYEFSNPKFYRRDDVIVEAGLVDRNGSGKIRNAVINLLSKDSAEKNSVYMSGENFTFDNYRDAFDGMLQRYGLATDFGLKVDAVHQYIKSLPGNFFTC